MVLGPFLQEQVTANMTAISLPRGEGLVERRRGSARTATSTGRTTSRASSTILRSELAGQPLDTLTAEAALSLEGDRALAERFVTLFPLRPKIERPA